MSIDRAERAIAEAHEDSDGRLADLYPGSGAKKYSDVMHAEQVDAALGVYDLAVAEAITAARWRPDPTGWAGACRLDMVITIEVYVAPLTLGLGAF